jgi:hypothetical protein
MPGQRYLITVPWMAAAQVLAALPVTTLTTFREVL